MNPCSCPSCVSVFTGTCELCWERPFDYVDPDGQRWNMCIGCAALENPTAQTWPG